MEVQGGTADNERARPSRGRPHWWVILAVSLALMALVAAASAGTSGARHFFQSLGTPHPSSRSLPAPSHADASGLTSLPKVTATTSTTSPAAATRSVSTSVGGPVASARSAPATTAPLSAPTTTAATEPAQSANAEVYPGYLQPPSDSSTTYSFSGTGAMRIAVTWSSSTYLTLAVSCSGFNQPTGGSSAMAVSIPDAQGTCRAVLSEPSSEDVTVSYSISIGPSGD